MARAVRRIVTGHDAKGRSIIVRDGPAPSVLEVAAMPGLVLSDLWETTTAPADNRDPRDAAERPVHLEPAARGTIFRIVDFPPSLPKLSQADTKAAFGQIAAAHATDDESDDAMMHKTASVDYAIVLEGEIWAVMDAGETLLKPGDVQVQRGTNHSWRVEGETPARVAFILVGAAPL